MFPIWDSVTGTLRTRAGQHAEERRQAIAQAADKARHTRDLLARHGIACPTITGAGTGTFEFETASGVYTELQCGSCVGLKALAFDSGPSAMSPPPPTSARLRRTRPARRLGRHQPARARRQDPPDPRPLRDPTVNLYDWYVCVRNNRVEQLSPITARGAVY